jgi:hypothetical protein
MTRGFGKREKKLVLNKYFCYKWFTSTLIDNRNTREDGIKLTKLTPEYPCSIHLLKIILIHLIHHQVVVCFPCSMQHNNLLFCIILDFDYAFSDFFGLEQ